MSNAPKDKPPTSQRDSVTLDDFELGEEFAWGSLATVMEGVHKKSQKKFAIKMLNKSQLAKKKMIRSAMVEKDALIALSNYPHPGIVRLHYCFQDPANLYFVEDLASNGDLKGLTLKLGSLSLDCARYYTAQMVDAILLMHEAGIAHRDIKPENCLLDEGMRIKIADFGSAYIGQAPLKGHRTSTFVGTAAFLSPEVLLRSEANPRGPDIWAVGACLYFYITGTYPFAGATDYLIMERIKKMDFSIPDECDPDAADLIRKLLVTDPTKRLGVPPASSARELKHHSFFVGPKPSEKVGPEEAKSESPPQRYIDWDTLWTVEAPETKAGLKTRVLPEVHVLDRDKIEDELWSRFEEIHVVEDDEDTKE